MRNDTRVAGQPLTYNVPRDARRSIGWPRIALRSCPATASARKPCPRACACSRRRRAASASSSQCTHFDWSCDYYAKHGRMMPEDWFEQLRRLRGDLLRGRRLAGHRARSRVAVGLAHPVPARLRPVRQHAPVPADAGHPVAARRTASRATSTSSSCARTPRASTRRSAGACTRAPTARSCSRNRCSAARASTAS